MDINNPPPDAAAAADASADADADEDPIVGSYSIYTNPSLPTNRKLLILQHPNKQGPIRNSYPHVSEVRTKPRSGMIEVDVPLSHAHSDYDRDKGLKWGFALQKSTAAKNGGSHGLSGGFGVGVPAMRGGGGGGGGGKGRTNDFERDVDMLSWGEAVRQDKVLRTQTLGGQFPVESQTNCRWMVGVFKGDQLHLTPATAVVNLRPQLHHLDALAEQDRLSRPREGATAAGAAAGGKEAASGPQAARAIHMSIKSAGTGSGELTTETMADRLRIVQTEPWNRLKFEDDDSNKTWDMFANNLVYRDAPGQGDGDDDKDKDKDNEDKGKVKGKATEVVDVDAVDQQRLRVQWDTDVYLRAVSGMVDGPDGGEKQSSDAAAEVKKEEVDTAPAVAGAAKKAGPATKGKGKATAAAAATTTTAAKRGAKGKSVAFKGAMEVD